MSGRLLIHVFLALVMFSLIMDLVWAASRVLSLLVGIAVVVLYLRWQTKLMARNESIFNEDEDD